MRRLARLTADLLRSVPIADVEVRVQEDYVGRNTGHFYAVDLADGKALIHTTALFQREGDVPIPAGLPGHPLPVAPKTPEESISKRMDFGNSQTGHRLS